MKSFLQKSAVREALKALAFLAILLLVLSAFRAFFRFKFNDGVYSLETFYAQEEDTVDVLFLGSSHVFENIHTGVLYDEFGMAAFDLGGSVQPMWNTYHYLVEALKTQTPSLVVLEGYALGFDGTLLNSSHFIKNTFGFRPSLNQLENLRVTVPEDEFWAYFFQFYNYHSRYDEDLSAADFYPDQGMAIYDDWKGYLPNYKHVPYETPRGLGVTDTLALHPKTETYYRKIIELCQSRNIPLHIVVVPFYMEADEQMHINRAAQIAGEYGVPFTDYNAAGMHDMLGFDYGRDMALGNHLTPDASARFTRAMASMLLAAYDIPDRRGDARYASWARSAAYYRRDRANRELSAITALDAYLSRLQGDPDYTVFLSVTGFCQAYFDQIAAWLEPLGVDDLYGAYDLNGTWALRGGEVVSRFHGGQSDPGLLLDQYAVAIHPDHYCLVNNEPAMCTDRGLNLVVYDHVTRTLVDTVGFEALSGFTATRARTETD